MKNGGERYSMKADNIEKIISDIDCLPYRAILFDGTWGIGKSYAVNEALTENSNVCKISMFGLKDPKQIYHEALQYCEELKEDCDNMSRHRIDVLIEEIVKK